MINKKQSKHNIKSVKDNKEEFLDSDHTVMDTYYMLMDSNVSFEKRKKTLERLIMLDPDFYDPYLQLAYLLQEHEEEEKTSKILYQGYQRAITRITDKDGNFPKSLPWVCLENRHIIRIINAWANNLWEERKTSDALEIFRKLLKSNPNDNIGARHSILAIRLGLNPDYEAMFEMEDMSGYMDASKVIRWFDKNSKKFPDEFDWWQKKIEEKEGKEE